MLANFDVTIGIEVHTVLNTKTKMFSRALNSHTKAPNTIVSFMDLALPGILPIVNKQAINKGIILADALHMKINYSNIQFDRKNYFYCDLPKGFQITQQFYPIGQHGYIEINDEQNNPKKIYIERIHLEEDTAKQIIENNERLMDYNRAGDPLIEIVTEPCIHSAYEACQYLEALRKILIFKDISDAKLEEGSLRADINISVKLKNKTTLGTKVEIKNINSINNVMKAINYEINRQISCLLNNQEIEQETRRFDEATNSTIFMRKKSNSVDYRYMTDPNVMYMYLSDEYVDKLLKNANPGPNEIIQMLSSLNFEQKQINLLLENYDWCKLLLELINKHHIENKLAFNWITVELAGILNKLNINFNVFDQTYKPSFITLLSLLNEQEINSKQAKILLDKLFNEQAYDILNLIKALGFEQIKDEKVILEIINKYIDQNQDLVKQYHERAERVEKFLVGMVMKDTNSQANPNITMQLTKQAINDFLSKQ